MPGPFFDGGTSHDITLTRAWIEGGNTLCIKPVVQYEANGSYDICFLSAFIRENQAGEMAFGNQKTSVPVAVQGSLENPMVQSIEIMV